MYTKWDNFELPRLTEDRDYGIMWPKGTRQITKELLCFKSCRDGRRGKHMLEPLIHFLNIQRMLFPHLIELYKDVAKGRIWNNYYLDLAELLCDFTGSGQERTLVTGPASANKTYGVSSYMMTSFFMAPNETFGMVSTTSGSASERRIWGDIKTFHAEARYEECGLPKVGECIEYLKSIVYDEGKELGGAEKNNRDFRKGIQVIPIATDSSGDAALSTIQGSKNKYVLWALDEMAQMNPGVTRPLGNLGQNPHFHFIGIGNANDLQDPHGQDCMPIGGIDSLSLEVDRRWVSATGKKVLFLHGEESPNNHPFIEQSEMNKVTDFPFPYASNPLSCHQAAIEYGAGDIEAGKNTIDYWKFCIGFWPPVNASNNLYSRNLFTNHEADKPHEILASAKNDLAAADFAFSVGGDANAFIHASIGYNAQGQKRVNFDAECLKIRSNAKDKTEFVKQIAKGYVKAIRDHGVPLSLFGADTGNDASLTLNEISRETRSHDMVGISSVGAANNKKRYVNRVTELWFDARDLIKTGCCRGINLKSGYFKQLIQRRYSRVGKLYEVERKRDMKKRTGSSPDEADAFIYLCFMIIRTGFFNSEIEAVRVVRTIEEEEEERFLARVEAEEMFGVRDRKEDDDGFDGSQLTEFSNDPDDVYDYF